MLRVLFVPLDDSGLTRAAWSWLIAQPDIASVSTPPDGIARNRALVRPDVIWIDGAAPGASIPSSLESLAAARPTATARDPGLLLTRGATTLPTMLGIESVMPSAQVDRRWRNADDELFFFDDFAETPRLRGHAAFRRHRLFRGLGGGAYTWRPVEGERDCRTTWLQPVWPRAGRVVAVERAFIHVNAARATIWEYDAPFRILCVGAYLPYESADQTLRAILDRLTRNILLHTAGRLEPVDGAPDLHWPRPDARTVRDASLAMLAAPLPADMEPLPVDASPVRYPAGRTIGAPFTIAGRRAFAAGLESTGVAELWIHPLRALMVTRSAGLTTGRIDITPLGMSRHLRIDAEGVVIERVAILRDLPAAVFEWEVDPQSHTDSSVPIEWSFDIDLRLMWPLPAGALGPLHWNVSADSLVCRSPVTGEEVRLVASRAVDWHIEDGSDQTTGRLRCALRARVARREPLRVIIVAHVLADRPIDAMLAAACDPVARVRAAAATLTRTQERGLRVDAPDARVATAFECAISRLDSYRVETPGLGRSLVAGYWTSRPGWNEARPGYAWYFGRDAVWTALASLAPRRTS
ncbi:MAG: hypothetical protein L0271_21835 [Gemmatimonadetes bacterium]|nr:hypothetical protein [Gemmatimonadota bacterium]